jgi:hypothetical protein
VYQDWLRVSSQPEADHADAFPKAGLAPSFLKSGSGYSHGMKIAPAETRIEEKRT